MSLCMDTVWKLRRNIQGRLALEERGTKQVMGRRQSILNHNYAVPRGSKPFRFICTLFLQINPQTANEGKCLYTKEQSNPEEKISRERRRIDQMESKM